LALLARLLGPDGDMAFQVKFQLSHVNMFPLDVHVNMFYLERPMDVSREVSTLSSEHVSFRRSNEHVPFRTSLWSRLTFQFSLFHFLVSSRGST
jgi:hypothetical protein